MTGRTAAPRCRDSRKDQDFLHRSPSWRGVETKAVTATRAEIAAHQRCAHRGAIARHALAGCPLEKPPRNGGGREEAKKKEEVARWRLRRAIGRGARVIDGRSPSRGDGGDRRLDRTKEGCRSK